MHRHNTVFGRSTFVNQQPRLKHVLKEMWRICKCGLIAWVEESLLPKGRLLLKCYSDTMGVVR